MSRKDIQKLLGGYATGTLTPEEEQILFEAALDDQELFDTLAREQSLRDLLRDPAAKAQLLSALDAPRPGWFTWWRPAAAVAAMAAIAVFVAVRTKAPAPVQFAIVTREPPLESRPQATVQAPLVITPTPGSQPNFGIAILEEPRKKAAAAMRAPLEKEKALAVRQEAAPEPAAADGTVGARAGNAGSPGGVIGGIIGGVPQFAPAPPPPPVQAKELAAPIVAPARSVMAPATEKVIVADTLKDGSVAVGARELFLRSQVTRQFRPVAGLFAQQQKAYPSPSAPQQEADAKRVDQSAEVLKARTGSVVPLPGVRYTVLRRSPEGRQDEVNVDDMKSGDTASVRLESNSPGQLYTWARRDGGTWRTLASFAVEPMKPYVTPALQPGENEVYVWFSRTLQMAMSAPTPPALDTQPGSNAVERAGALNYVVNPVPVPPAQQVRFTIRLP